MTANIQTIIAPHVKDLGGFEARRLLPSDGLTMVGPFIFFDHMGPATFPPGHGVDVRPHPHINLATVTYLFEGSLMHRDSLGTVQEIHPGAINWMTAGKGISHSERTPDQERAVGSRLHGIQTWVALPDEAEEIAPSFIHHPATEIPAWEMDGVKVTLIAGRVDSQVSPVKTFSPILYLDVEFTTGGSFTLASDHRDRAIYSVDEGLTIDGEPIAQHRLVVLRPGNPVILASQSQGRCIVIGGEPLGERHKWWNFVSSRPERIEQAKHDWVAGKFDQVPGETEMIPLPTAT
jgi:hypothetical protein